MARNTIDDKNRRGTEHKSESNAKNKTGGNGYSCMRKTIHTKHCAHQCGVDYFIESTRCTDLLLHIPNNSSSFKARLTHICVIQKLNTQEFCNR